MCLTWCENLYFFFFFKQKTAYEMRISDWSSDVCSSDLIEQRDLHLAPDRAPAVRIGELVHRERAHRHRERLRPGVAANPRDDGHQRRERDHMLDRAAEQPDDRPGDKRGAEVCDQPAPPPPVGFPHRPVDVADAAPP